MLRLLTIPKAVAVVTPVADVAAAAAALKYVFLWKKTSTICIIQRLLLVMAAEIYGRIARDFPLR